MGRHSEGVHLRSVNGIFHARFTHRGQAYTRTTGHHDRASALVVGESLLRALQRGLRLRRSYEPKAALGEPRIYVIEVVGVDLVKIGWSRDPEARLQSIRRKLGLPLRLLRTWPGSKADEAVIHARHTSHRIAESEWFHRSVLEEFGL